MSILYEPFKDEDAISAALDRYWERALLELMAENDCEEDDLTREQIEDRALIHAQNNAGWHLHADGYWRMHP